MQPRFAVKVLQNLLGGSSWQGQSLLHMSVGELSVVCARAVRKRSVRTAAMPNSKIAFLGPADDVASTGHEAAITSIIFEDQVALTLVRTCAHNFYKHRLLPSMSGGLRFDI